jgi:hypothetical protein
MSDKIKALFGCQIDDCAAECSYHADMLRLYDGAPVCEGMMTRMKFWQTIRAALVQI